MHWVRYMLQHAKVQQLCPICRMTGDMPHFWRALEGLGARQHVPVGLHAPLQRSCLCLEGVLVQSIVGMCATGGDLAAPCSVFRCSRYSRHVSFECTGNAWGVLSR